MTVSGVSLCNCLTRRLMWLCEKSEQDRATGEMYGPKNCYLLGPHYSLRHARCDRIVSMDKNRRGEVMGNENVRLDAQTTGTTEKILESK